MVRLPVTNKAFKVLDPNGNPVQSDVVPIPTAVLDLKERVSKAKHSFWKKMEPKGCGESLKTSFVPEQFEIILSR